MTTQLSCSPRAAKFKDRYELAGVLCHRNGEMRNGLFYDSLTAIAQRKAACRQNERARCQTKQGRMLSTTAGINA